MDKFIPTPFLEVLIGEEDISRYVSQISFEDCTKEDDIIKISIPRIPLGFIDKPEFQAGKIINYRFGYVGGKMNALRKARITDIDVTYGEMINITITAHDFGQLLKKAESSKVWKKQTSTQIVQAIADTYGMKTDMIVTKKIWDQLPQGNATDWDFLKVLATKEGYQVIVKEDTITFKPLDLSKPASKSYKWNFDKKQSDVINFKPSYKDSSAKEGTVQTPTFSGSDIKLPEIKTEDITSLGKDLVNPKTERKDASFNSKEVGKLKGKTLHTHGKDSYSTKNHAKHKAKEQSLKVLVAKLKIYGDPLITAGEIITVEGVDKKFGGNWYVEKVIHSVGSSAYETELELTKNGSNAPLTVVNTKGKVTNTKPGQPATTATTTQAKKPVKTFKFDSNSNPVKQ